MEKSNLTFEAFCTWAYSDLLSNAQRGVLAEYIVGCALDALSDRRTEWDAYDLLYQGSVTIEVKSSAYVQSWAQKRPSIISFDIAERAQWDHATGKYSEDAARRADIYVFAVFAETDPQKARPLDPDQWFFLVTSSVRLNKWFGNQQRVNLSVLQAKGLQQHTYAELREAVDAATKE